MTTRRAVFVALAVVLQLGVAAAVLWPRISARLGGEEVRLAVQPVDPIDPTRGAYVDLSYDLTGPDSGDGEGDDDAGRDVFYPLTERRGLWVPGAPQFEEPAGGRFLRCHVDDGGLDCGIESFFASQDRARQLETELGRRGAVAVVKVDDDGNAAIVDLIARGRPRDAP